MTGIGDIDEDAYYAISGKDLAAVLRIGGLLRGSDQPPSLDTRLDWGNRLCLIRFNAEFLPPEVY